MNRRSVRHFALLAALSLALSACGNKGPLVLPGAPVDTPVPAESAPAADPAATPPAEPAPPPADSDAKPPR
ncbi:MAG: LPS translocon maturation chaperone LptM [Pseudomonadota bacterium]